MQCCRSQRHRDCGVGCSAVITAAPWHPGFLVSQLVPELHSYMCICAYMYMCIYAYALPDSKTCMSWRGLLH